MYRSNLKLPYFLNSSSVSIKVISVGTTMATIIKFVMALAAEADFAALFISTRKMVPHRQTFIDMGWPQPCSPIQMDNSTAVGVTNKTIFTKRANKMDMKLWWLQCCGSQKQFHYYWDAV
jgi:hypothetical protein